MVVVTMNMEQRTAPMTSGNDSLSMDDLLLGMESLKRSAEPQPPLDGERCAFCGQTAVFEVSFIENDGTVTFRGKRCLTCFTWAAEP